MTQESTAQKPHTAAWWRSRMRLWRVTEWAAVQKILIVVTATVSILLGVAIAVSPDRMVAATTFDTALEVAPPTTWGVAFAAAGLFLSTCFNRVDAAELAALVVSILFAAWGILTLFPITNGGLLTAPVSYLGLSAFSAVTSIACGLRTTR